MDYNKYSIVNLNNQPFTAADNNFDWMEGVTLTNVPDSLKGVSAADVVQYDASSVNLSTDGIYEVSYYNNNTNPHIVLQPNVRTVEVGMSPVTTTYSYDSEVPYYTLPYEYKGLINLSCMVLRQVLAEVLIMVDTEVILQVCLTVWIMRVIYLYM